MLMTWEIMYIMNAKKVKNSTVGMWKHFMFVRSLKVKENSHHKKNKNNNWETKDCTQLFKVQLLVSLVHFWPAMELYKDFRNICTQDKSNMKCIKQQEKYVFISGRLNEWVSILFLPQSCFTHFCSPSTKTFWSQNFQVTGNETHVVFTSLNHWWFKRKLFLVCALWHLLKTRCTGAVCKWIKDMNPADANHIWKIMGDFSIPKSK